ncbi:uncharacterized protein [Populus alba]|uniref:uncharacterized protein n=1 Tax=Populus alba TaxID=43335 RepID=UPI003CC7612A
MEDEERAHRDAHFQEELESLKTSVARLTSLLEQTLRNASGEGPSNRPVTFNQTPIIAQPEEKMSEHGQEPQHNPTFVQSTTPAPAPTIMDAFANESHQAKSSDGLDQEKIAALEARIKVIEGVDLYDPVRAAKMCLVPNVVVPKKFRVPEFIKYSGTQCLMTHLKSYCNKMAEVVHDEKLLMHFFQDSLSGVTLSWYMRLDNTKIRRWKDLVDAFIKQYNYNMDIAPDRTSLSNLEKRDKESIREYAQRWRESAAQSKASRVVEFMHPPRKEVLKGKRLTMLETTIGVGKPCPKITILHPKLPTSKNPSPKTFKPKAKWKLPKGFKNNYPPLPLPLNEMYRKLLSIGQVAPEPLTHVQPPYPNWYKPELNCEYHAGVAGHSIHTCNAFKRKLLQLIKAGWIELEDAPNVNTNPLPNHA